MCTRDRVDDLIELLGLREHLNKKIDQLSGGQKQRVALARTLVMKPKKMCIRDSYIPVQSLLLLHFLHL